jgi:hypothetical protein
MLAVAKLGNRFPVLHLKGSKTLHGGLNLEPFHREMPLQEQAKLTRMEKFKSAVHASPALTSIHLS